MPITINVNNLTLCHKGSGGVATATLPDVCKTPPSPVPIPYPNIAFSKHLKKGTKTIKVDGGNMAANKGSEFSQSTGDEPGVAGGVKSGTNLKEATWLTYSFDVKLEGKNACRLTDKMLMNHGNTVCLAGELQRFLSNDKMNLLCNLFCEALEKAEQAKKSGKRFDADSIMKKLAKDKKYAKELVKYGMKSQPSLLVRVGKELGEKLGKVGRKLYDKDAIMGRIKRKVTQMVLKRTAKEGAEKAAFMVAKKVAIKFIPIVNVASIVLDIYDGITIAKEAYDAIEKLVIEQLKDYEVVRTVPDIGEFADDALKETYDFKFEHDTYKDTYHGDQDKIYKEATGKDPITIDKKACNNCQKK